LIIYQSIIDRSVRVPVSYGLDKTIGTATKGYNTIINNLRKVSHSTFSGTQRRRYYSTSNSFNEQKCELIAECEKHLLELESKLIPLLADRYKKKLNMEQVNKTPVSTLKGGSAEVLELNDRIVLEGCKSYVLLSSYLVATEVSKRFRNSFKMNVKYEQEDIGYNPISSNDKLKEIQPEKIGEGSLVGVLDSVINANEKLSKLQKTEIKSSPSPARLGEARRACLADNYVPYNRNANKPAPHIN